MVIRKAERRDKSNILKIASRTWHGWDFVPLLIDDWFEEGGFFVAEEDGEIVGVTKTTTLSHEELWLEGIRVKEEMRGRGIGKQLALFQLEEAKKQRPRIIRLSTAEINTSSIKIIETMGFKRIHVFGYMKSENPRKKNTEKNIRTGTNYQEILNYITNSSFYHSSKKLLPWSWIFRDITPSLIETFVGEKRIFLLKTYSEISGLAILLPHRYSKNTIEINFIDGETEEEIKLLFNFAQSYANAHNFTEMTFYSPNEKIEKIAVQSGLSFPYDFKNVLVYELVSG